MIIPRVAIAQAVPLRMSQKEEEVVNHTYYFFYKLLYFKLVSHPIDSQSVRHLISLNHHD